MSSCPAWKLIKSLRDIEEHQWKQVRSYTIVPSLVSLKVERDSNGYGKMQIQTQCRKPVLFNDLNQVFLWFIGNERPIAHNSLHPTT